MEEKGYVKLYTELVEKERREEMRKHEEEIRKLSGREREKKGRAFLKMKGKALGLGLGGKHLVKFQKQKSNLMLPESEIEVGDLVLVSKSSLWEEDNPTGTVSEKTKYSITVAFDEKPPGFVYSKNLRIDLFVNDITFKRMLEAIKKFKTLPSGRREKLLGKASPDFCEIAEIDFFNKELNGSQKKAVFKSLGAKDFFLIHGPPGTGKTITCVEVIAQLVKRNYKILASADSNVAVDNLVERLNKIGVKVVRIGHPARVILSLREKSLDYLVQSDPDFIKAQELREKGFELKESQERFTMPWMRWRRGLSDDDIIKLATERKTTRGIPKKKIESMGKWLDLKQKMDAFFEKARELEEKAVRRIISEAEVVCSTNSTVGSELLRNQKFDYAVVDEATQSTEPSSLIPVTKAKRFIMAGDHKQLPPTILNKEAAKQNLSKSLFERLLAIHEDKICSMLEIQYRMNEEIAKFSNKEFYNDKLKTDERVKKRSLGDLTPKISFEDKKPFLFIDTARAGKFGERRRVGSTSRENPGEANLVQKIAERLLSLDIKPEDIAIISPYEDQVGLIRKNLMVEGLEIKTVDGFQGREKEVVIVSFVRSNESRDIGFLKDLRRLNVSLTRSKRKLILIGDSNTLESEGCYKRLIELAKERGAYKRVV